MHLNDDPLSLYDVLELTPDATPQEIRSAYLRLKSSYGKDNIAHYTVFSREETEQMLSNIEGAYLILSNPERRRAYDQNQNLSQNGVPSNFNAPGDAQASAGLSLNDDLNSSAAPSSANLAAMTQFGANHLNISSHSDTTLSDLDLIIRDEKEWGGAALKRVREARRISLEDLADYTRISKSYLLALEEEDFNRLPAIVYVRGFLQQVSRRLKLPVEPVSNAYLIRLKNARPDKA